MDDEQDTGSTAFPEPGAERPEETTAELAAHEPVQKPASGGGGGSRAWMRTRGAIGGAAVGIAAVFGLGGFALGHATADDGHPRHPGLHRFHHFSGDRDGRGMGPRMRPDGRGGVQQPPNVAPSPSPSAGSSSSSEDDSSS